VSNFRGPSAEPSRRLARKIKNHLFRKCRVGAIDLHYRDYEEPPGNGGFLLNGGRLYLDMGHLEYFFARVPLSKGPRGVRYCRGTCFYTRRSMSWGWQTRSLFSRIISIITPGATFGCHENYLMRREAQFTPEILASLLAFLAHPANLFRRRQSWAS